MMRTTLSFGLLMGSMLFLGGTACRTAPRTDGQVATAPGGAPAAPPTPRGQDLFQQTEAALESLDYATAGDLIRRISESGQDPPRALFLSGVLAARTGDLPGAKALWFRYVALKPGDALGWHNLGNVAYESGDDRTAVESYQTFLRLIGKQEMDTSAVREQLGEAVTRLAQRPGADPAGIFPPEKQAFILYRKFHKQVFEGQGLRFNVAREIMDKTSQVSILMKNLTDAPIPFDLRLFELEQEGNHVTFHPKTYLPGMDEQPWEGLLPPGKWAYLVIGCPQLDLTLPVTILYPGKGGTPLELRF